MHNDFNLHDNYGYGPPRPSKRDIYGGISSAFGVLHVAFLCFLVVVVIRLLTRSLDNIPTFTSLLDMLSSAPYISFDWLDVFNFSLADMFPVGLQWLGSFFDFFVDIFRAGMFVGTAVVNVFPFLYYFFRWVFVI